MDGDDGPVCGLLDIDAAGVLAKIADGHALAPYVVQGAADAGRALYDDVPVGRVVGEDAKGGESLVRQVLQLLRVAECSHRKFAAIEIVPNGSDVRAAVGADGGQSSHVRLAEERFDVCGDRRGHIES